MQPTEYLALVPMGPIHDISLGGKFCFCEISNDHALVAATETKGLFREGFQPLVAHIKPNPIPGRVVVKRYRDLTGTPHPEIIFLFFVKFSD